jgi:hypothetical protein
MRQRREVSGQVTNKADRRSEWKGVPGADVTVYDASRNVLFRTHSDAHGKFSVPRLQRDDQWLNDKDFHVEISASGFVRYNYILLRSGDSRKVLKLHLVLPSGALCNDLKIINE